MDDALLPDAIIGLHAQQLTLYEQIKEIKFNYDRTPPTSRSGDFVLLCIDAQRGWWREFRDNDSQLLGWPGIGQSVYIRTGLYQQAEAFYRRCSRDLDRQLVQIMLIMQQQQQLSRSHHRRCRSSGDAWAALPGHKQRAAQRLEQDGCPVAAEQPGGAMVAPPVAAGCADREMALSGDGLLCFNCLVTGHERSECGTAPQCSKCERNHNTLLHGDERQ